MDISFRAGKIVRNHNNMKHDTRNWRGRPSLSSTGIFDHSFWEELASNLKDIISLTCGN